MGKLDLQKKIESALDKHPFAAFATVEDQQPSLRYMTVFREGLTILLATDRKTHKVEELQNNPRASLLLGLEGKRWPEVLVEVQGTVTITKETNLRAKLWNDDFKQWFDGVDDPNYVILKMSPSLILYTGKDGSQQVWRPE